MFQGRSWALVVPTQLYLLPLRLTQTKRQLFICDHVTLIADGLTSIARHGALVSQSFPLTCAVLSGPSTLSSS